MLIEQATSRQTGDRKTCPGASRSGHMNRMQSRKRGTLPVLQSAPFPLPRKGRGRDEVPRVRGVGEAQIEPVNRPTLITRIPVSSLSIRLLCC